MYEEARAVSFSASGNKNMTGLQFVTGRSGTKMSQS